MFLVALGFAEPWLVSIPLKPDKGAGALWVFVPPRGLHIDYSTTEATLIITLIGDSQGMISLGLPIAVNSAHGTFEMGLLQPMTVIEERCYVDDPTQRATEVSTIPTREGEFFTTCEYDFNQTGPHLVVMNLGVTDPLTTGSLGKRGFALSFFGGQGFPEIAMPLLLQFRAIPAVSVLLALTLVFPTGWSLDPLQTAPRPARQNANSYGQEASWTLHFDEKARSHASMVSVQWTVPSETSLIGLIKSLSSMSQLAGTILLGSGFFALHLTGYAKRRKRKDKPE